MTSYESLRIFVSCAPGLESILKSEIAKLNIQPAQTIDPFHGSSSPLEEKGGLEFDGTLKDVYRCNLSLRTASRVVVRLGEFHASAFSELRKKAGRLPWEKFLIPGQNLLFKVTCHKSKLYHSDAVAERILGAVNDHFLQSSKISCTSEKEKPGLLILVRLVNDMCTISIDSTGELLHRRGYRQAVAKAPLRETLAAGMLLLAGWNSDQPLIDPFCGSGTIPIEAGLMAENVAPGITRKFGFGSWANFQPEVWNHFLNEAKKAIHPSPDLNIYGYDRDRGAIESAESNASRAGLKTQLKFRQQPISDLEPATGSGWIITNPPYGVRVSQGKDLRNLYARLGTIYQSRFPGWKLGVLCNEEMLLANLNLGEPARIFTLVNGGIPVKFACFE